MINVARLQLRRVRTRARSILRASLCGRRAPGLPVPGSDAADGNEGTVTTMAAAAM